VSENIGKLECSRLLMIECFHGSLKVLEQDVMIDPAMILITFPA